MKTKTKKNKIVYPKSVMCPHCGNEVAYVEELITCRHYALIQEGNKVVKGELWDEYKDIEKVRYQCFSCEEHDMTWDEDKQCLIS